MSNIYNIEIFMTSIIFYTILNLFKPSATPYSTVTLHTIQSIIFIFSWKTILYSKLERFFFWLLPVPTEYSNYNSDYRLLLVNNSTLHGLK